MQRIGTGTKWVCAWAAFAALPLAAQQGAPLPTVKQETVVTGTFEEAPLGEMDRDVSVVRLPLPVQPLYRSPFDLLQLDSSLDLRQRGANGIQGDLSIRGGSFGQTLVLLNGLRFNDVQTAHANLDLPLPLEAISQVEVLKGAGSTLYGSDAVGGVVNFRTGSPEAPSLRLRGGLGTFGTNTQGAILSLNGPGVSEQLAVARDFSTGFLPDRDYRSLALSSSTLFRSPLGSTSVLLALSDRPFGADQFYGNFNSWERTKGWFASLHQNFGEATEVALAYRRHTDLFVLYRDRPAYYTNRHADESWQGVLRRSAPLPVRARLHYGVEAVSDAIASNNLGNHARTRASAYASYDVRALRRFSFSAGLREEVYRRWRGELSPNVSGAAWLSSRWKLRAAVSHAFRLPNYTDLYYSDPANLGNPKLRPERAWSQEAGLDSYLTSRLRASFTVFRRSETDGIDYIRYTTADRWRAENFDHLQFTGAEASVHADLPQGQRIEASYTGLRGANRNAQFVFSKYAFSYPVHRFVATWQGGLPGGLVARSRFAVAQRYQANSYGIWDAAIGRGGGKVRPFLQARNLAGTRYTEVAGIPMPGREILGGFEWLVFGRN